MARIFGFDIGTTSIGFVVMDHDPEAGAGEILRLGVRRRNGRPQSTAVKL
ncbi:MAG TPA: hypothetical protein VHS58_01275 [Acetobacteraceae bacterium]|nr:hypothetical protein [Acetobacteraceae bacterium]